MHVGKQTSTVSCGRTFRMTGNSAPLHPNPQAQTFVYILTRKTVAAGRLQKTSLKTLKKELLWLCLVYLPRTRAPEQSWEVPAVRCSQIISMLCKGNITGKGGWHPFCSSGSNPTFHASSWQHSWCTEWGLSEAAEAWDAILGAIGCICQSARNLVGSVSH